MQNFEEGEEVFFDSFECLSFEEPVWEQGDQFGYDVWLKELYSVKERREKFFCKMGTTSEFKFTSERIHGHHLQEAVCSSSSSTAPSSPIGEEGEDLKCGVGRDCSLDDANCLVDDDLPTSCPTMKTKKSKWWKPFLHKLKGGHSCKPRTGGFLKVRPSRKKKFMELTALYGGQEIKGHTGVIRTMKFSPDGQYLASGGEDGIVRVWRVLLAPASGFFKSELGRGKKWGVEIPEKVFQIEESPLHEFYGHTSAVLDLAWSSTTNSLLSSSKDNTVRLWKVGSDECHGVFHHNNYVPVTCIQFNPIDEDLFISGCIDGKARVWRVTDKRVADWADIHDIVTAICYQPNGKGFIVGSISGVCHFYQTGSELYLDAEIQFGGRRSTSNIITGIQFLPNGSQKFMITSGDSKIRILDGHEVVCKYRGPKKSGNHTSAAHAAPNGKHVISIGEDSQVYLWNYEDRRVQDPKQVKSERSFEHFFSEKASIAIPWVGETSSQTDPSPPRIWVDSERYSLGNWFSTETSSRVSVTWPEEVLPLYNVPTHENGDNHVTDLNHDDENGHLRSKLVNNNTSRSPAWGLVIVTAGLDGRIRTFHNYGLPVRV